MDRVVEEGSARIDLLGGTLDLWPIHLILPHVVTLNAALSLKVEVIITPLTEKKVVLFSRDYQSRVEFSLEELPHVQSAGPLTFLTYLLQTLSLKEGMTIEISSTLPPNSGLGGSTVMGVTAYKALLRFLKKTIDDEMIIKMVMDVESRILNQGPPGYQDGYPAVKGGILALRSQPGKLLVEQIFSDELKHFLEHHLTLVYSGVSRSSGINNWQVYKSFFDGDQPIRQTLEKIADLSYQAYLALQNQEYPKFLQLMIKEGEIRKNLAPNILTPDIYHNFLALQQSFPQLGIKVCGAGGGGCFLLIHEKEQKKLIKKQIEELSWKHLPLSIEPPLKHHQ